jgi:hypothetical protein
MRRTSVAILAVALLPASCSANLGERPDSHFLEAPGPARAVLDLSEDAAPADSLVTIAGPLIAADRERVVVETPGVLYSVSWGALRGSRFVWGDTLVVDGPDVPSAAVLSRVRLLSAHPHGYSEEDLRSFARARQAELVVIPGPRSAGGAAASGGAATAPGASDGGSAAASGPNRLLEVARRAGERYRDRESAVADGFRQVGPSFPGMGEHWAQPGRVTRNRFDPAEPPILTYVTVDGEPLLTGVAYTLLLAPGEKPPAAPFPDAWHDHRGTVHEETLLLSPHAHGPATHGDPTREGPRFVMVHAWIGLENPAGTFAQDNWALPFVRLGIPPPDAISPAAGKALHLLTGGDDYYLALVRRAADPTGPELDAIRGALAAERARVSALIGASGTDRGRPPAPEVLAGLESSWRRLWSAIEGAVSARTWEDLRQLAG